MAVTVAFNPNESIEGSPKCFYGISTDTKPTVASHDGLPEPSVGSTFYAYDTGILYITYDGTNWAEKDSGAYTTPTHTAPTIGNTTTVALAANTTRRYLLLVNDSTEDIYIKLGAAAVMNQGIRINANGGSYEMSKKLGNLYTGAINGICTSGSKILLVTEGV